MTAYFKLYAAMKGIVTLSVTYCALRCLEQTSCEIAPGIDQMYKTVPDFKVVNSFDVENIYGFVWWGVCKQSRWRHSITEPSEDSGYVLLWQRYDNNKMVAMRYYGNVMTTTMSQYSDDVIYFCCWRCIYWACYRCILHLQQYSHRLNLLYFIFIISLCFWN